VSHRLHAGPEAGTVVWFRRDLRLHDHPALAQAVSDGDRIAPLFVLDDNLLAGTAGSPNRLWFMRESVAALARGLASRGAPLSVLRGDPAEVVPRFAARVGAQRVMVSRDHAPYGRARDEQVAARLRSSGIDWEESPGLLILEPEAVASAAGQPFRVFGPFQRAWLTRPMREARPAPDRILGIEDQEGQGAHLLDEVLGEVSPTADPVLLLTPGEAAARDRLAAWAESPALDRYASDRDRLDLDGTSRLSQDLRWGLLSPIEVAARCVGPGEGRSRFLSELAWRDFYAHVLWHEPRAARASLRPAFERVAWERDPGVIDAWREGRTGYPVVDAAMRQLRATGWMHNRARMIVASFLTKHLGVDWRVGARHFMDHLVDGDVASNSGGWQWAASTGTDPQPWFRVFSPTLQGRRHDPNGEYVRRWVPELAGLPGAEAHEPPPGAYLPPIVDHAAARQRALDAYRSVSRR
jgi:deoxyribodipyrimidine photo-lyase